jgi:uncharacterized membrane protein
MFHVRVAVTPRKRKYSPLNHDQKNGGVIGSAGAEGKMWEAFLDRVLRNRWYRRVYITVLLYAFFVLLAGVVFLFYRDLEFRELISRFYTGTGAFTAIAGLTALVFYYGVRPLFRDNLLERSSSKLSSQATEELSDIRVKLEKLQEDTSQDTISQRLKETTEEITKTIAENIQKTQDLSDPDKLFQASRGRLGQESLRIDRISRRNLYFGIVFSAFALAFLAWPLVAQTLNVVAVPYPPPSNANAQTSEPSAEVFRWLSQTYLPRFAVGILLQFVGFFFLRLYVANELDLKHNKNEMTNIEMKMIGLQVARVLRDASSKKEIVKVFAHTERNFVLKKGERTISSEELSEYNDLKSVLEGLISKIPGARKSS